MNFKHRGAVVLLVSLVVSGCASFSGMPEPVLDQATSIRVAQAYDIETSLTHIAALPESERRAYRNRVIAIHLGAADLRYIQFRTALSSQVKGTNLGLDLAVLGLTGVGAVANSAANELSAAAAALTGTRASINRELYFERTLPALIANMDAARLRTKTAIISRLGDPVDEYPLEQAFSDLVAYQMAGSIDGAIQNITVDAANNVAEEQRDYEQLTIAYAACNSDDATALLWGRIQSGIRRLDPNTPEGRSALDSIAAIMGLTVTEVLETTARARRLNEAYCSAAEASGLIDAIRTQTGRSF